MCEEHDSPETLEPSANWAAQQATIVECGPDPFRFAAFLEEGFKWSDKANGLRLNLTSDEGDPIRDYEVVILKPGANIQGHELGLDMLREGGAGNLTYYLETICMPLRVEDALSPWLIADFELERYSKNTYW